MSESGCRKLHREFEEGLWAIGMGIYAYPEPCDLCGGKHPTIRFLVGTHVKVLSMMPHILKHNPFYDPTPDRTGQVGVVCEAWAYPCSCLGFGGYHANAWYLVNFNLDPGECRRVAPFKECQLEVWNRQ